MTERQQEFLIIFMFMTFFTLLFILMGSCSPSKPVYKADNVDVRLTRTNDQP